MKFSYLMLFLCLILEFTGLAKPALAERPVIRPDAVVAIDESGDFTSIEAAIYSAPHPADLARRWIILVKTGIYRERVYVQRERGNIALVGEDALTATGSSSVIGLFQRLDRVFRTNSPP